MEKVEFDVDISSLPKEKTLGDEYVYKLEGHWHKLRFIEPIKRVINHFNPLPNDVIMATSPKTGTTWLKSLLFSILNRSLKHKLTTKNPHELVPFLEGVNFKHLEKIMSSSSDDRRLFSTHISYRLLSKTLDSSECKVVYLTRNPKDTLVSMWHFLNKEKVNTWTLDEATDAFCRGVTPAGPFYDHVIGYRELSMKRPENVMFLTYEEMKEDPHGHVKKLGGFLGCPFQEEDEDEVDEIVKNCSFDVLSRHEVNKSEGSLLASSFPTKSFFRKGIVGDHENYLSNEAIRRIDALTKERFHSIGFMYGI